VLLFLALLVLVGINLLIWWGRRHDR
jgi:hypothetical protein